MDGSTCLKLRKPCACGSDNGHYILKGGQSVVYCSACNKYQGYNAPKTETGLKTRSVSTTHHAISAKLRSKVIDRSNSRCERCGKPGEKSSIGLHVGHVISVADGHAAGLSDAEINSPENLIAECDECNLGHGKETLPLRLMVAILYLRANRNGDEVGF